MSAPKGDFGRPHGNPAWTGPADETVSGEGSTRGSFHETWSYGTVLRREPRADRLPFPL